MSQLADWSTCRRWSQTAKALTVKICFIHLGTCLPSVLWCCWSGGRKGIGPVKNWAVGCWHGYLSGAQCRLAYGPADATHSLSLASVKSRLVLPFWYQLTRVVPDKGPLNGCECVTWQLDHHYRQVDCQQLDQSASWLFMSASSSWCVGDLTCWWDVHEAVILYRCELCFLLCRQVRMPNVDNQHKPQRGTVVPDFVFKRVVKYNELSLDPLPRFVRYSDPRAGRNDQPKVSTNAAICWTRMRPDVSDWMHHWELYLQTIIIMQTNQVSGLIRDKGWQLYKHWEIPWHFSVTICGIPINGELSLQACIFVSVTSTL